MWDLAYSVTKDKERIEGYLGKEYEPFAVTTDPYGGETIWFRKEVEDEIHSEQSKLDTTRSRKSTSKTKG